jgi:hypothetical protein
MTTSSPNAVPPAGGANPDPDADSDTDTLLAGTVEGAVPDDSDPETDVDEQADSVEDDKRRSGG